MEPTNVIVQVRFLHQDEIIGKIQSCFEQKMLNSAVSRTYCAKNLTLDTFIDYRVEATAAAASEANGDSLNQSGAKLYPYQMTRMDHKVRRNIGQRIGRLQGSNECLGSNGWLNLYYSR